MPRSTKEHSMPANETGRTGAIGPGPAPDTPAVHNPSVDEAAACAGACGQVHLPTGAMCAEPRGHDGSCAFVPRPEAEAAVASYRSQDC
jgi:hypothetical protein